MEGEKQKPDGLPFEKAKPLYEELRNALDNPVPLEEVPGDDGKKKDEEPKPVQKPAPKPKSKPKPKPAPKPEPGPKPEPRESWIKQWERRHEEDEDKRPGETRGPDLDQP